MSRPLRQADVEPAPIVTPLEQRIQEEEDFFSLVADRQEDFDLPYFPDPEGA